MVECNHGFIPIHDHPNMCVLSNVLYGELDVWSCDWSDPLRKELCAIQGGLVNVVDDNVRYNGGQLKTLFPVQGGNLHEFSCPTATETERGRVGSAILDVIIPPYDEDADRLCTYYEKVQDERGNVLLQPAEYPDFYVNTIF